MAGISINDDILCVLQWLIIISSLIICREKPKQYLPSRYLMAYLKQPAAMAGGIIRRAINLWLIGWQWRKKCRPGWRLSMLACLLKSNGCKAL
jgi:hypothetical protein